MPEELLARLRDDKPVVWTRAEPRSPDAFDNAEAARHLATAEARWQRFAPALAQLFATPENRGRIFSPLLDYPRPIAGNPNVLVKADHSLPISACVKARGGVFGLLCLIESIATEAGLLDDDSDYSALTTDRARKVFAEHTVTVASTGNLGFSIGIVASAFGLQSEVHMSDLAQEWKKSRLREIGSAVIEYSGDYTSTVASARQRAAERGKTYFIDDENSWDLFIGYAGAARELAGQLDERGIRISAEQPLVVYLPCGVGGAPGGITYGLRAVYGDALVSVFVEPTASACMLLALAGGGATTPSVYDVGLDNRTAADGLAVSRASPLVLDKVRSEIDAIIAVPDQNLLTWVRRAWNEAQMQLEPSAAAAFAAYETLSGDPRWRWQAEHGRHVVWTTGGDMMPADVFDRLCAAGN